MSTNLKSNFKEDLSEAFSFLKKFTTKPIESIRHAPQWEWQTLLATALIITMSFGALSGLIKLRFSAIIAGAIAFPFGTLMVVGTLSALVYYTSLFLFHKEIAYRRVATLSFLACLPWVAVGPFVDYVPPLKPLAVLMSGFLAVVAFTENTKLTRKEARNIVGTIVSVFVIFWVVNMIRSFESQPDKRKLIDQEALNILQEEMQKTK